MKPPQTVRKIEKKNRITEKIKTSPKKKDDPKNSETPYPSKIKTAFSYHTSLHIPFCDIFGNIFYFLQTYIRISKTHISCFRVSSFFEIEEIALNLFMTRLSCRSESSKYKLGHSVQMINCQPLCLIVTFLCNNRALIQRLLQFMFSRMSGRPVHYSWS